LEFGANVNCVSDKNGMTPIFEACCKSGNLPIVKYLVECGAYIDKRDNWGT